MTIRVQIFVGVLLLLALFFIIHLTKKRKLDIRYAMMWAVVILVIGIFDAFPQIMDNISSSLGIGSPTNMIFFLGFCLLLVIVFFLTKSVARLSEQVRKLIQEIALLQEEKKSSDEDS